jgi:hypothetical protein
VNALQLSPRISIQSKAFGNRNKIHSPLKFSANKPVENQPLIAAQQDKPKDKTTSCLTAIASTITSPLRSAIRVVKTSILKSGRVFYN